MIIDDSVIKWIKNGEGYDNLPYIDTAGKLTIGYGRNLADNGISIDEGELMFQNDLRRAIKDVENYAWYQIAPDTVKKGLINMSFNLGLPRLLGFKKMIEALTNQDYTKAAMEALNSKWAIQIGNRAKDIAVMFSKGNDEIKAGANSPH